MNKMHHAYLDEVEWLQEVVLESNLVDIDITGHIRCLVDSGSEYSLLFRARLSGDILLAVLVQMFCRFRATVN